MGKKKKAKAHVPVLTILHGARLEQLELGTLGDIDQDGMPEAIRVTFCFQFVDQEMFISVDYRELEDLMDDTGNLRDLYHNAYHALTGSECRDDGE